MRRTLSWSAMFVIGVGVATAMLFWDARENGAESAPRPNSKITISKETTIITEPLTKDGYVDYLASLNAICSKGVTPENNAAVLLYQAFGPKDVPKEKREHVAGLLGIKPLRDDGKYFVDSSPFLQRNRKEPVKPLPDGSPDSMPAATAQFERARERPWSNDEFPLVAAWLEENEQSLDLIVAASKRPRFYFPLFRVGEPAIVIEALLPMSQHAREAARALPARAMSRLKAGKIDEAWQDVLTCHRLARLIGQGPTLVEGLVGVAIEGTAMRAGAVIAHYGGLSAERARCFADDLRQLPPMAKMADKIVICERFTYLDAVSMIARRGPAGFARLARVANEAKEAGPPIGNLAAYAAINWDEPMRMGNAWYDRLADAFAKPTRTERNAAMERINSDLRQLGQQVRKDAKSFLRDLATTSPSPAVSRQMGQMCVVLLLPGMTAAARAEDSGAVCSSISQVAFALAAYRAERGAYPAQLAQLSPKHLAAVPEDPFANGPLRYKRTETGCIVYSVGINGKDDGGASRSVSSDEDASIPPDADDVAIVMPWPKKR